MSKVVWLALSVALVGTVGIGCHSASGEPEAPAATGNAATAPAAPASPGDGGAPGAANLPTGELNGGCAPAAGAGHQTVKCTDGVVFDVEIPAACAGGGCGAILDVHGWSMDGPMQDRHTRMRELAGPKGYVIVQPTAPGDPPSWSTDKPTGREFKFDDTVWGFFKATMQRFGTNADRIHMTGFSQGGMMTFRFLYAHGEVFASVAPIAGPDGFAHPKNSLATSMEVNDAPPPVKVPILYTHGTKDRLLDFDRAAIPLRDQILKSYGLTASEIVKAEPAFRASRWKDGSGRVMFEMWDHDFVQGNVYIGGHCLTGPVKKGDGEFRASEIPFRCVVDGDKAAGGYDVGVEIVRFFEEHPRGK